MKRFLGTMTLAGLAACSTTPQVASQRVQSPPASTPTARQAPPSAQAVAAPIAAQPVATPEVAQPVDPPAPAKAKSKPVKVAKVEPKEPPAPTFTTIVSEMGSPVTFDSVFAQVREIPRFKDEFETTSQFEERQAVARADCEKLYLIETPVDDEYARYDADKQILVVVTYALTNTRASSDELNAAFGYGSELRKSGQELGFSTISSNVMWALPRERRNVGTYDGSNAFGATATITKQEGVARGVFEREGKYKENVWVEAPEPYKYGKETPEPVAFEIKADPSTAKALKEGGLRAAILVSPAPPFYVTGVDTFSPTLRAPYDRKTDVRYLIGDIQCAALYDANGKLLATRATR